MLLSELKRRMSRDTQFGKVMADILRSGRGLWYQAGLSDADSSKPSKASALEAKDPDQQVNLIGSQVKGDLHAPAIDIDFYVRAVPSKTPGHYHLYFDRLLDERQYDKLLKTLTEIGYVEQGYYDSWKARGQTYVRIPELGSGNVWRNGTDVL